MGVTAICLSVAFIDESKADAASCPSPIPLGLTTALTGNLALLGTQARNGVEFAVDEINAAGGIEGKKLALSTEDTGASSTDALNAMNRILESKPLVVFGSMISPHVFAQTEGVTKSETPFLVGNQREGDRAGQQMVIPHPRPRRTALRSHSGISGEVARQDQAWHYRGGG